jgi:DNA-binding NtrC family response regulator
LDPKDVRSLYDLSKKLFELSDYQELLDAVVENSRTILRAEQGFLVRGHEGTLTFYRRWGAEDAGANEPVSRLIVSDAVQSQEILLVPDAQESSRYRNRDSVKLGQIRSVLAAPLDVDEDMVLYFERRAPGGNFGERERALLSEILSLSSRILVQCARRLVLQESRSLSERFDLRGIVARDPKTIEVLRTACRAAPSNVPVLVQGPSGSGKELVVRAIHRNSLRAAQSLVVVNCAAIAPSLLESELFGHTKGAFTGATDRREGLLASADGGTLFLDEIGDMSLDLQVKILRTLQFGEVKPVGSSDVRTVDVRVLAATHRDLEIEVEAGRFREDLLYRLNAVTICIPPLSARPEDVLPLFYFFLEQAARREARVAPTVEREAERRLVEYSWPGNARELENEAKRLVVMISGANVRVEDLSPKIVHRGLPPVSLEASEKALVEEHLRLAMGNRSKAARSLGISREGLRKKMKRLGLDPT